MRQETVLLNLRYWLGGGVRLCRVPRMNTLLKDRLPWAREDVISLWTWATEHLKRISTSSATDRTDHASPWGRYRWYLGGHNGVRGSRMRLTAKGTTKNLMPLCHGFNYGSDLPYRSSPSRSASRSLGQDDQIIRTICIRGRHQNSPQIPKQDIAKPPMSEIRNWPKSRVAPSFPRSRGMPSPPRPR